MFGVFLRCLPIIYLEVKTPGWHENNINEIEFYYDDVARSLLAGKGFVHSVNPRTTDQPFKFAPGTPFSYVPPLYAWYLYMVYKILGPSVIAAKLLQSLIDASVCFFLFSLGKRVFNDTKTAILASALYAVYPLAVVMCSTLYYQIPMNVSLCLLILCFMAATKMTAGIWTGTALGITTLAKPVTLPLIAIMPIVKFLESFTDRKDCHSTLKWIISFWIFVLLTLMPWTIRNYQVFHEFVPVQKGAESPLLQGSRDEYIDLDVETLRIKFGKDFGMNKNDFNKAAVNNHIHHYKNNAFDYMRFLSKKFILSWYNTEGKRKNVYVLMVQAPFLLLAVLSLLHKFKFWLKKPNYYIPAVIMYICAIQVIFFPLARYTLVIMPFVMLMSANGIFILLHKFSRITAY